MCNYFRYVHLKSCKCCFTVPQLNILHSTPTRYLLRISQVYKNMKVGTVKFITHRPHRFILMSVTLCSMYLLCRLLILKSRPDTPHARAMICGFYHQPITKRQIKVTKFVKQQMLGLFR